MDGIRNKILPTTGPCPTSDNPHSEKYQDKFETVPQYLSMS